MGQVDIGQADIASDIVSRWPAIIISQAIGHTCWASRSVTFSGKK
jgi:hypothetical protein